jgi:hypothetical protein
MSCLNLMRHVCAIVRKDGEQVHLPRGLAGSFETAGRPRWTTCMSKVHLAVWRRPARTVCQVLMTKADYTVKGGRLVQHLLKTFSMPFLSSYERAPKTV